MNVRISTNSSYIHSNPGSCDNYWGNNCHNYRSPGEKTRITVQHFAAGVVFAAVAIELLPELVTNMQLLPLIIGFLSGVALMLVVRWGSEKFEGEGKVREAL